MESIERPSGAMDVHVAVPEGTGPWPGVVVIHDALGMSDDLRAQADWLAQEGFLAVAPDLYYRGGRAQCLFATIRAAMAREGQVFDDLEATRTWLAAHPQCTGTVGVIGFCMGGGLALLLAADGAYDASSVNYGAVPKDATTLLERACPVVASYGARDRSLRTAPRRLEAALRENEVPFDIKVYDGAGHSFMNRFDEDAMPRWAIVAGRWAGVAYDERATLDARARISSFFRHHLGARAGG